MLYVRNLPQMREFYGNMLQIRPSNTEWTDTWAFFDLGGTGFALHAIPEHEFGKTERTSSPLKREHSPVKLIFAVDDVLAERARLQAMGATIVQHSWQGPAESCDCVDPEGNIFQIAARDRLPHLFGRSML